VCETLGRNLAIIKTDADIADLNTAVTLSNINQTNQDTNTTFNRAYIREFASKGWKWYTGQTLDVAWPYLHVRQPDFTEDNVCA